MRLFFALLPDSYTRDCLSMAAAALSVPGHARLLAPENYHVTLAFVGEVHERDVPLYRELGAALDVPQCAITLSSLEYWSASQAVVLAAHDNPSPLRRVVDQLHAAIVARVPTQGLENIWRAHATLARKVAQAPVLTGMSVSWVSRSFALMRSDPGGSRAAYTVVDSWSLLDKN